MGIKYKNNAITTITSDIDDEITTIPVSNAAVFPELGENDYCYLTIGEGNVNMEIVKVTAIVGNNLTVVREQQGTVGKSFLSGAPIELRLTAGMLQAGFYEVADFASSEASSAASIAQSNAISSSNGYTDTSISNLSLGTASQATVGTGDTHLPTVATVNTKVTDAVKINTLTEKETLVDDDVIGGENSASAFSRIKIKCLAIFNYIKSKFGFDFDKTTLTVGKTFQVVDVGGGDLKIQQVNFPGGTFVSLTDTPSSLTANNYLKANSVGTALQNVANIPTTDLSGTANSVPARANTTTGALSNVTLSANQLLGRGSTGNVAAISVAGGLSFSGSVLSSSTIPDVYTGSTLNNTAFPIGTTLQFSATLKTYDRNESVPLRIGTVNAQFADTVSGTILSGTWRAKGQGSSNVGCIATRTA